MRENDLIRRGDALAVITLSSTNASRVNAINALPPAKQDDLASGKAVTVEAIIAKVPTRYQTVNGDRLLHESDILAALEPVTPPAPDALLRCAECSCDDGNCTWIATDDDIYPYDAIEQCERDLDGVDEAPVVNEKLRTMHQDYLQAIAEGRLVTDAVSPTDARLRAAVAQLDAGDVKEAWEKAYWRMRSYAVHDNDCKLNKPPRFDGPCSCGLTAALEEALALISKGSAEPTEYERKVAQMKKDFPNGI